MDLSMIGLINFPFSMYPFLYIAVEKFHVLFNMLNKITETIRSFGSRVKDIKF